MSIFPEVDVLANLPQRKLVSFLEKLNIKKISGATGQS